MISIPKARARFATSVAMLPAPTRPRVFWNSSVRFSSLLRNLPSFMEVCASIRRAGMATMKAMAISATATLLARGVLMALMPRSAQSFLSTLSMPTPPRITSLRFGALARRSASTLVLERTRRTVAWGRLARSPLTVPKAARRSGSLASKASAMRMCMGAPRVILKVSPQISQIHTEKTKGRTGETPSFVPFQSVKSVESVDPMFFP